MIYITESFYLAYFDFQQQSCAANYVPVANNFNSNVDLLCC